MAAFNFHPCSEPSTLPWYAVYVRSRHEKTTEHILRGKGYAAFSPCYSTKRKRTDRTVELDLPLFPGYVFCQFDPNRRLPILKTPGVVSIVGPGNRPESIEESEIASIHAVIKSGRRVQPWLFLAVGQKIRILAGPLYGAEGTLLKVKNEYKLIVSVTLLQRAVAVEVDQDSVIPQF